ncbi:MAG: LPS assembly lipoprotein LptE [Kiritimatiellaceae bacterium]|nr:LPS assembly lipoprotein LptE [Kiritimatiellaceae bacterium]
MKFKNILALVLFSFLLAGCAGYQVGSTLPEDVQSVLLKVVNNTTEPSIEVAVMKALRAEVQADGRLKLAHLGSEDVVLTVTLNRFSLTPLAFDDRHHSLTREYRMMINASSVLTYAETDEVIVESTGLWGEGDFPYEGDLTSAKRYSAPPAAKDLAMKVVSLVTTAW